MDTGRSTVYWSQEDGVHRTSPLHRALFSSERRTRHGHVEKSHQAQGQWKGPQPSCLEDLQVVQGILPGRTEPFPATCQGLRKGKGGGEVRA